MNRLAALRQTTSPSRAGALAMAGSQRSTMRSGAPKVERRPVECHGGSWLDSNIAFGYQHPPGEDA